ncbi:DUF1254 domain-containing protein [Cellulosimicrobium sp. 22601]|uniref:DUF1254 domain-containing protein n=1 Tax=unclassified Cellulosimicrobium TaxID=2624466 RepID=UPI003F831BC5
MSDRYDQIAGVSFEGGYPSPDARRALDDELFFQRATQVYLWSLPAVNMYAMKVGLGKVAGTGYNVMSVGEKRLKPRTVITTPNSDVIYGLAFANLAETGPLVIEAPPHLQALLDDFWHRPLTGPTLDGRTFLGDIGLPGPDRGEGGRYLVVPEGYEGEVDHDEYFVYTSGTDGVFLFVRGFFRSNDDLAPGVAAVEGITVRPLHGEALPMRFEHVSDRPADALFPRGAAYFDMLDEFVQSDRVDAVDPYMHGMLAALGIVKGGDFRPTERQRALLEAAAVTGRKMAKNVAANFDEQDRALWWEDRRWVAHVLTEQDDFMHTLLDEEWRWRTTGHTHTDAKAHMYVNHYSISTGMMSSVVGMGAKYGNAYKDSEGRYLRGEATYRLDMPADPPASLFWSVTLYDADTAAGVDAEGQEFPSLNSMDDLVRNDDGSVTFHVGPERPAGPANWLRTVPGRGWFSLFRLYGPTQPFFDREYKPGDFVHVEG